MKHFLRLPFVVLVGVAWLAMGVAARSAVADASPIYIEDSPAANEALHQAASLAKSGRLTDAAIKYQSLIDEYSQKLSQVRPHAFVDMRQVVLRQLMADDRLIRAYRSAFEGEAARRLDGAMSPVDPAALEAVAHRFTLTAAGIDAALLLAVVEIERGHPLRAAGVINRLPQSGLTAAQEDRRLTLAAAAALFGGDSDAYAEARATLMKRGVIDAVHQLDQWQIGLRRPDRDTVGDGFGIQAGARLPEDLAQQLWRTELPFGQFMARAAARSGRRFGQRPGTSALPAARQRKLFVNDSAMVLAFDRFSGRMIWRHDSDDTLDAARQIRRIGRYASQFADVRSVAIDDQQVYAVMGEITQLRASQQSVDQSWLLCLSQNDGGLVWRVLADELDSSLSKTQFHGTPILRDGRVYVQARRTQSTTFSSSFVVALDAATGALVWKRHISSAAVSRSTPGRQTLGQMIARDGKLYVVDNLGAAARVDMRGGEIEWLVMPEDQGNGAAAPQSQQASSWYTGPLVVTDAGLVMPTLSMASPAIVLDLETGVVKRTLGGMVEDPESGRKQRDAMADTWVAATQMVEAPGGLLIVGPQVAMLDGRTFEPRWTRTLDDITPQAVAGRVGLTENEVVIPLRTELLALRLSDGRVKQRVTVAAAGHVLVLEDQVVVAEPDSLQTFMPFTTASASLRAQIKATPDDAMPGLSLAHAALSRGDEQTLLEGIDAAMASLDRLDGTEASPLASDAMQQAVFLQLRAYVEPASVVDGDESAELRDLLDAVSDATQRALLDRLGMAARTPADRVGYHFARGRAMARDQQWADALHQYQAVLSDPLLADQLYSFGLIWRVAGLEAELRQRTLIEQGGDTIYDEVERQAEFQFAATSRGTDVDADALVAVARRFPLSRVAGPALASAGDSLAVAGRVRDAVRLYRQAFRRMHDAAAREQVAGKAAALYMQADQVNQAVDWLSYVAGEDASLRPWRDGEPRDFSDWRDYLSKAEMAARRTPRFAAPFGDVAAIQGRVLAPALDSNRGRAAGRIISYDAGRVTALDVGTLAVQWSQPVDEPPVLLSLTPWRAALWLPKSGRLAVLDASSGDRLFDDVPVAALAGELTSDSMFGRTSEQRDFDEVVPGGAAVLLGAGRAGQVDEATPPAGMLFAATDDVMVASDGYGRSLAVDLGDGRVRWRRRFPVQMVVRLAGTDGAVALAGHSYEEEDARVWEVHVVDPQTGAEVLPTKQSQYPITWMSFASDLDQAALLIATGNIVQRYPLATPSAMDQLELATNTLSGVGRLEGQRLLLRDHDGSVFILDVAPLALSGRVSMPPGDSSLAIDYVDGWWYLISGQQAAAVNGDGEKQWRDAVAVEPKRFIGQVVSQRHVLVLRAMDAGADAQPDGGLWSRLNQLVFGPAEAAPPAPEGGWRYQAFLMDRHSGSIVHQAELKGFQSPILRDDIMLLDGKLLLPTAHGTIVVNGGPGD